MTNIHPFLSDEKLLDNYSLKDPLIVARCDKDAAAELKNKNMDCACWTFCALKLYS